MGRNFTSLLNDLNKVFKKVELPYDMVLALIFVDTFFNTVHKLTGTGLVTILRENHHWRLIPGSRRQVLDQSKRSPCLQIDKIKHISVACNNEWIVLWIEPRQCKNLRAYLIIKTCVFNQTSTLQCLKQETWFIKTEQEV